MRARKLLRRLAGALFVFAAVPALLLGALVLRPQWILTSRSVGRAVQVFGRAYHPRWNRFEFQVRSPDVFEKEFSLSAANFCFAKADGSLSGCFKKIEVQMTVEIDPAGARVTKISRLQVQGETLRSIETAAAPPPPAAKRGGIDAYRLPRLLPASLSGVKIDQAAIDLPSVEIVGSSATTKAALHIDFDPARPTPLALDARWAGRGPGGARRGRARVAVSSDFFKTGRLTRAEAKGSLVSSGASVEFSAKATQAGVDAVALEATASGRGAGLNFRFQGRGVQTPASYALTGSLDVRASTGPLISLQVQPFVFSATKKNGAALPGKIRLEAGLKAEPAAFRPVRGFTPPRFIEGRLVLNASASPTLRQKDHFDADLSIILNPYLSWYEAHVDLFARASGRTSDLARMRIKQSLDANVTVPRFEDLVSFLAGGPLAIPAPLTALKGGVRASVSARGEPRSDRIEFDYRARGDLSGEKQKLKFRVDGGGAASRLMTKNRLIQARAAVKLDDVALQAPHLDVLKMPKVTLDPRIRSASAPGRAAERASRPEAAASTTTVVVDLAVATSRPVVVYTDLAKTPVPIALDLKLDPLSGSATGLVEVKSFDVEFFRRRATVDHLTLTLSSGSKHVGLDGLVKYKADEAMIFIRLLGTSDKPQVVFDSDPPLNQSDIIGLLVFGKSPDELDADQAATVANTQTAMSDKAFGLASLYLFASTPIQFVGYDPAAKAYTMKLRIPGGETLSVSSDFEATKSVQLRKRLSRNFALVTEAVNSQTEGNSVVTFLEWFIRY
ncbi:MAG: translocation/assembly module TamB domain-containing protein [Elusimicrobiota bacterium]